ncbi:hypothetical protein LG634_24085 [Streptomyces bambusae]|nr:SPFH domain-containing protein [Streptomyces bambusae]MCB5167897.1 hypothetical protein [Streptomyces bambusae]
MPDDLSGEVVVRHRPAPDDTQVIPLIDSAQGAPATDDAQVGAPGAVAEDDAQVMALRPVAEDDTRVTALWPVAEDDTQDLPVVPMPLVRAYGVPGPNRRVRRRAGAGEIPVHLMFRDGSGAPAGSVPLPAVPFPVTGPRPGRAPGPEGGPQPGLGAVPDGRPRSGRDAAPDRGPQPVRGSAPDGARRTGPGAAPRPAAPADPQVRERPGPVLPGWVAVLAGGVAVAGGLGVLGWAGAWPGRVERALGLTVRPHDALGVLDWTAFVVLGVIALLALGGLGRGRVGHAWVLTLFGRYRGTVRRTGLLWVSPLLLRRRVDVRLRHWRSDPVPAVDAGGLALRVVVQVVWRVRDTARATLAVEDHTAYLVEQVESALARVLSQLPADAFHEDAPTLRDAEAVGDALTRMLAAETAAVGIDVYSAQPTRIEYAPEVAAAMQRRRVAAIDAKHRDSVLSSVVDAVDDTIRRLTSRGIVELDDYERKALVKDLTVAFYTGRQE